MARTNLFKKKNVIRREICLSIKAFSERDEKLVFWKHIVNNIIVPETLYDDFTFDFYSILIISRPAWYHYKTKVKQIISLRFNVSFKWEFMLTLTANSPKKDGISNEFKKKKNLKDMREIQK